MCPFALASRYPAIASLPRVELVDAPTPLDTAEALGASLGIGALSIKRDDLTSPRYGGNKVRKLEFLLGEALAEQRRAVITFGAYGSNHALATAVFSRSIGLEPHVVLSPQAPGPFAARTLRAHAGLGTGLHLVEGWDGRRTAVEVRRELTARDGIEPYVIPMGGTNALGALGYVNAALEVLDQVESAPDVVYVAGGTLGTAVGLAIGFAAAEAPTRVVGVRVTPAEVANPAVARDLVGETVALLRSVDAAFPEIAPGDLHFALREDWFEPGYGVVTPETAQAVRVAAGTGITLETTYTGKAFAAMSADAATGALADARVLYWDTYSSAPMPAPGPDDALPAVLREYIAECDALFGHSGEPGTAGTSDPVRGEME